MWTSRVKIAKKMRTSYKNSPFAAAADVVDVDSDLLEGGVEPRVRVGVDLGRGERANLLLEALDS